MISANKSWFQSEVTKGEMNLKNNQEQQKVEDS